MPPWLLALIVLVVVCAIGWYVIYSRHAGVPEGFQGSNHLDAYIVNYFAPALYNLGMETSAKGITTTIGSDTIPYASLFSAWVSGAIQQRDIQSLNTRVKETNDIIIKEKLTTVSPLLPYTAGMTIPDIQPVFNLTQVDKTNALKNYGFQYVVQSFYKIIQEINSKKLLYTVGPNSGQSRAIDFYFVGLEIARILGFPETALSAEQKIQQLNAMIKRINDDTLAELKLTSVQSITPYTVGMVIPTVASAPSTGRSASSAVTARGTPTTPAMDADYQALAGQALTGQTATLTPELKSFLEQIKGKASIEYPAPSAQQLGAAQGQDTTAGGSSIVPGSLLNDPATYKAFQQIVKPHETPTVVTPGLTANQRGADGVQADAILTPSMRQQIRDDVRRAVGEELANIQNEYEITYEQ